MTERRSNRTTLEWEKEGLQILNAWFSKSVPEFNRVEWLNEQEYLNLLANLNTETDEEYWTRVNNNPDGLVHLNTETTLLCEMKGHPKYDFYFCTSYLVYGEEKQGYTGIPFDKRPSKERSRKRGCLFLNIFLSTASSSFYLAPIFPSEEFPTIKNWRQDGRPPCDSYMLPREKFTHIAERTSGGLFLLPLESNSKIMEFIERQTLEGI